MESSVQSLSMTSSLSSVGCTPSRDFTPSTTRDVDVYKDAVQSSQPFWIEINPTPNLNRDAYEVDDEEFNIVGIFGEIGEGDDILYDIQFEDDHTATVASHVSICSDFQLPVTKLLCYTNGSKALNEYQNYASGRKRLRARNDYQNNYADVANSDQSASEDEITRSNPHFDMPRRKRQRTLHNLSQKFQNDVVPGRTTRSSRSGRLLSLRKGYREDESDITLSDSHEHLGTRRSSRMQKTS